MSATNPTGEDRDSESMRKAQRAHEPSMEEILASIRSMMGETRGGEKATSVRFASVRTGAPSPQIVYSKGDSPPRATQEALHRGATSEPEPTPLPEDRTPSEDGPTLRANLAPRTRPAPEAVTPAAGPVKARAPSSQSLDIAPTEDEPLLSREAGRSVTTAFEALSANLAAHGAEVAREMAREMLRPMLKGWLDENLPGIVERLVRAEIERVARGIC